VKNYIEKIDFTKIEIFLLIGAFIIFLPLLIPIDDKISDDLKSYEHQNRIYIAFAFAMGLLILSVILSRKGYTSYTPWLEKLANDKLEFDLQLFQHVDDDKLKKFYYDTFKLAYQDTPIPFENVKKTDVLGWKPIDEDEKWYSIFTEKIDYRFYEIFFNYVYSEWNLKNYEIKTNSKGEYIARDDREDPNLYENPELTPLKNNEEIKKLLLTPDENGETIIEKIISEIPIFSEGEDASEKVKKIMIRKIQNDLHYYSIMINFRRGLINATKKWIEADDLLKKSEKNQVDEQSRDMDVGAKDLHDKVEEIINGLKESLARTSDKALKDSNESPDEDNEEVSSKKKISFIIRKMANRNNWDSDDWRGMGSVYSKWKKAGKKENTEKNPDWNEIQGPTLVERFWDWWHYGRKGFKKKTEADPTEEEWKKHRTIRAVDSLTRSFGYKVEKEAGKAVLFFGIVFGLIIAVALTNSLDILIGTLQTPLNCGPLIENNTYDCFHPDYEFVWENVSEYQYLIILFLCFFPLGILFYHQGTILLSAKAAEQMTLGSEFLVFVNFLFILLQAIIVYFLAASIGDVNSFLSFLILLVTIDAIWVTIFTFNDMRDEVRDAPVFIEWVIFDIIIAMFALVFMINYASVPPILEEGGGWTKNWPIFAMLLIVLTTRAAVDYSYGWKNFWSKFADAE